MCDARRKCRSDDQQGDSSASPRRIETRELDEEIGDVRCAIRHIGEHRKDEETGQKIERYLFPGRRPREPELRDDDESEDTVENEPAWFPVTQRMGDICAQALKEGVVCWRHASVSIGLSTVTM
jgi:hypothetical protein